MESVCHVSSDDKQLYIGQRYTHRRANEDRSIEMPLGMSISRTMIRDVSRLKGQDTLDR